jgi:hypothetical protein
MWYGRTTNKSSHAINISVHFGPLSTYFTWHSYRTSSNFLKGFVSANSGNDKILITFYFLIYAVWESTVIVNKIDLEIVADLHVFSTSEYVSYFLNVISLLISMFASLPPERLNGFYHHLVLKSLSIIGRCSVNINILGPKICTLHRSLLHRTVILSKMAQSWRPLP